MKELVCNYAIARFLPYRETGEFVNVGVVLVCAQVGYFDFLFERRKSKRISDFFPELDLDIFKSGLQAFLVELERLKTEPKQSPRQYALLGEINSEQIRFRELVRPRETLLRFGEVGTILAADPAEKLRELFDYYIKRQFAHDREYQEVIMRNRLAEFLREHELEAYYRPQQLGDDNYHVNLPFVYEQGGIVRRAIKPLHLAKKVPTEIYRHGDFWISSVKRLSRAERFPRELLFAVKMPRTDDKCTAAAKEICSELEALKAKVVPFGERDRILEFARV